ncbi:alpha/beta fold hydrolase [Ulvibacterium sp.]|uniref:alpha/beta hydrolase family protein n=1 Tax=Ulvibacterium sp. TaxID=2665914 RepID=UPI0026272CA1|nr:alpha/beta fold hydrolase [Ulvibacterium sp.]
MNLKKSTNLIFLIGFTFICISFVPTHGNNPNYWNSNDSKPSELFHIPYFSPGVLNDPVMVLVLHGDAPFNNPSYQYLIAKKIAEENTNVVAVGILRPGYTDNKGNRSEGERGEATGDNYTLEVLESIHNLTIGLEKEYNPSKVVLVGHSGGGAISANLLARYSGTYSNAVLVSCPCDLHLWRKYMKELQPDAPVWDIEVNSLSPIEEVKNMDDSTQIAVVHGDHDKIVPIDIARKFVRALEMNNKKTHFVTLKNQGHEVALNRKIFEIVKKIVE